MRPGCSVPPLPQRAVTVRRVGKLAAPSLPAHRHFSTGSAPSVPAEPRGPMFGRGSARPSRGLRSPGGCALHPHGTGARVAGAAPRGTLPFPSYPRSWKPAC